MSSEIQNKRDGKSQEVAENTVGIKKTLGAGHGGAHL